MKYLVILLILSAALVNAGSMGRPDHSWVDKDTPKIKFSYGEKRGESVQECWLPKSKLVIMKIEGESHDNNEVDDYNNLWRIVDFKNKKMYRIDVNHNSEKVLACQYYSFENKDMHFPKKLKFRYNDGQAVEVGKSGASNRKAIFDVTEDYCDLEEWWNNYDESKCIDMGELVTDYTAPEPSHDDDDKNNWPQNKKKKRTVAEKKHSTSRNIDKRQCNLVDAISQYFTNGGSYGNWCGVGNGFNRCPTAVCQDGGFDAQCMRHDQGRFYWPNSSWLGFSVTLSTCKVDHVFRNDLISKVVAVTDPQCSPSSNCNAAAAKAAAGCVFAAIPCYNWEDNSWWWQSAYYEWVKYTFSYPSNMVCNGNCWTGNSGHPWVTDGYCDSSRNNAADSWDGGDCCQSTCSGSRGYTCGYNGYNCLI